MKWCKWHIVNRPGGCQVFFTLCHLCHLSTKCVSMYGWAPHLPVKCREIKSYRRTSWMSTSDQCRHSEQSACCVPIDHRQASAHRPYVFETVRRFQGHSFPGPADLASALIAWRCSATDRADWMQHKGRAMRRNHSLIFFASFFRLATIAVVCLCRSVC